MKIFLLFCLILLISCQNSEKTIGPPEPQTDPQIFCDLPFLSYDAPPHSGGVSYSYDGSLLAIRSRRGVWVFDALSGEGKMVIPHPDIHTIAFSPSDFHLAVGDGQGNVSVFNAKSGENIFSSSGHVGAISSLSFSPFDNIYLASGGMDGTIRFWNKSGNSSGVIEAYTWSVRDIFFQYGYLGISYSPNPGRFGTEFMLTLGTNIYRNQDDTYDYYNSVGVWDLKLEERIEGGGCCGHEITALAHGGGYDLVIGYSDGEILIEPWNRNSDHWSHLRSRASGINALAISPIYEHGYYSHLMAGGGFRGGVELWNYRGGNSIDFWNEFSFYGIPITDLEFSPISPVLAIREYGVDGRVMLWDVEKEKVIFHFTTATLRSETDKVKGREGR